MEGGKISVVAGDEGVKAGYTKVGANDIALALHGKTLGDNDWLVVRPVIHDCLLMEALAHGAKIRGALYALERF